MGNWVALEEVEKIVELRDKRISELEAALRGILVLASENPRTPEKQIPMAHIAEIARKALEGK